MKIVKYLEGKNNLTRYERSTHALNQLGIFHEDSIIDVKYDGNTTNIITGPVGRDYLLACCHHDAKMIDGMVLPGANDDASGVAVLSGLAEVLKQKDLLANVRLAFFGGEENGQVGSQHYVAHNRKNLPKAVFCLEWIGEGRNLIVYPSSTAENDQYIAAIRKTAMDMSLPILEMPSIPETVSDFEPFRQVGIPSYCISLATDDDFARIMTLQSIRNPSEEEVRQVFQGLDLARRYHTLDDNSEHISEESLALALDVVHAAVLGCLS